MAKKAIYYDEAKRLFVQQGLALTAIEGMLDEQISRRQLHNWKTEGNWEAKRKKYLEEHDNLQAMALEIAKTCARNAMENPSPKNLLAFSRALSALNQKDAMAMLSGPEPADQKKSEQDVKQLVTDAIKDIMGVG